MEHSDNHRYSTLEWEYIFTPTTYTKRERRDDERPLNIRGKKIQTWLLRDRLRNEHATLQFLAEKSSIPVANVVDFSECNGSLQLTVERIQGITLDQLLGEDGVETERYQLAHKNIERYVTDRLVPELHALRSDWLGGILGVVVPPSRIHLVDERPSWPRRKAHTDETFVFCHNDLSPHNIFLNPTTLEVMAIIDWEYSGFFPPEVDLPYWRRKRNERGSDMAEVTRLRGMLLRPDAAVSRRIAGLATSADAAVPLVHGRLKLRASG
ncbi:MAG: hypothetical protein M1817_005197 [Caeruleum heppii]|nr:MAG: hypothetical protein M1817_005197 [Caeruleum heppii]